REIISVLKREIKKKEEELEYSRKANRKDKIKKLEVELDTLRKFLPEQLNEEQLATIIKTFLYNNPAASIGDIMKSLKENYSGQYDGKTASSVARKLISESEQRAGAK
ncbi:MAG: hypothetical protein D6808_03535, partial [Candidatus Dadabacteria bacterium]